MLSTTAGVSAAGAAGSVAVAEAACFLGSLFLLILAVVLFTNWVIRRTKGEEGAVVGLLLVAAVASANK